MKSTAAFLEFPAGSHHFIRGKQLGSTWYLLRADSNKDKLLCLPGK